MKKITAAIIAALFLFSGISISAAADGLEDYNDCFNADGTYSYYFNQGITVPMPEEWYKNTIVKAYKDRAIFCHRDSYEKYEEEGIENGGRLFTVSYSVNSDFKDLDEMTYIGFDEETAFNYYATKPTDYQAYGPDPEIRAAYDKLFRTADEVIAGIKILPAERAESIYTIAGNDLFTFECASNWTVRTADGGILACRAGDESLFPVPEIRIFPSESEGTVSEIITAIGNEYADTYKNRLAGQPERVTYEVAGTDRKLEGISVRISSEDGMDTVTRTDLLEEINGQLFVYSCAYVSQTYKEDSHEDETTYFEFLHAIDTMATAVFPQTDLLSFCGYEGVNLTELTMTAYYNDCEAGASEIQPRLSADEIMGMTVIGKKNSLFTTGDTVSYYFKDDTGTAVAAFEFCGDLLVRQDGMYTVS